MRHAIRTAAGLAEFVALLVIAALVLTVLSSSLAHGAFRGAREAVICYGCGGCYPYCPPSCCAPNPDAPPEPIEEPPPAPPPAESEVRQ